MAPFYRPELTGGVALAAAKAFEEERIPMTATDVPESIGDDYKSWEAKNPVLLDAPTGSHKTTFVYTKLIADAISRRQNLILISNRIALVEQQRQDVIKIFRDEYPDQLNRLMEDLGDDIKEIKFIGSVCVCTYQGLYSLINRPDIPRNELLDWINRLRYAVFDEIDFLYSDALFNSMCGFWAARIPIIFQKAIRVYMTATSWEIKDTIMQYERDILDTASITGLSMMESLIAYSREVVSNQINHPRFAGRKLMHYYMEPDYSAYRLHFFGESSDTSAKASVSALMNAMKPLPNEFNKWLIFVHQKRIGQKLKETLKEKNISVTYIDASRKGAVNTIINNPDTLKAPVLISTSVISNGVNINDSALKNIGIFCLDRTQFIQQIGRKRLSPGETIDLWVWVPGKSYLEKLKENIEWHLNMAYSLRYKSYPYTVQRLWEERDKVNINSLFYVDGQGRFCVNDYTESILLRQLEFIKKLMNSDFRNIVEDWLGIKATAPFPVSQATEDSALEAILSDHIDMELTDEQFAPIRQEIIAAYQKLPDAEYIPPKRMDSRSAKKLTEYLGKLKIPYTIHKEKNLWEITKNQ